MAPTEPEGADFCNNCKKYIPEANYVMHTMHCHKNITLCNKCQEPVPVSQMDEHFDEYHAKVICKCGIEIEKGDFEEHEGLNCRLRKVECQFCELEMPFSEFTKHENVCGSRTDVCEKCGDYIMLREMTEHISNGCMNNKKDTNDARRDGGTYVSDNVHYDRFLPASIQFDRNFEYNDGHGIMDEYTESTHNGPLHNHALLSQSMIDNFQGFDPLQEDDPALQELLFKIDNVNFTRSKPNQDLTERKTDNKNVMVPNEREIRAFDDNEVYDDELVQIDMLRNRRDLFDFNIHHDEDHGRNEKHSEAELPCEICEQLIPLHLLANHQESCMMSATTFTNSENGRPIYSLDTIKDGGDYDNLLPCEFCGELISTYDLIQHQSGCQPEAFNVLHSSSDNKEETREERQPLERSTHQYEARSMHVDDNVEIGSFIPCEFCGNPFNMSDLIQHQSGCQPDLARLVQPPGGFNIRRRPEDNIVRKRDYNVPMERYKGPVSYFPCEFCRQSIPEDKLFVHQPSCPGNPHRHFYDNDEMLVEMGMNIEENTKDRSPSPESLDSEPLEFDTAINEESDHISTHTSVLQWLNSIDNTETIDLDGGRHRHEIVDNEVASPSLSENTSMESKPSNLKAKENTGPGKSRYRQIRTDNVKTNHEINNKSIGKLNMNGEDDVVPNRAWGISPQSMMTGIEELARDRSSARHKYGSSRGEATIQGSSKASQDSEKSQPKRSQQKRNTSRRSGRQLSEEETGINVDGDLLQNVADDIPRQSARSYQKGVINKTKSTGNDISERSENGKESNPRYKRSGRSREAAIQRDSTLTTTNRSVQTTAATINRGVQTSAIDSREPNDLGRQGLKQMDKVNVDANSSGTFKRNSSREGNFNNYSLSGPSSSRQNVSRNTLQSDADQRYRKDRFYSKSHQEPGGPTERLSSNRTSQQILRNIEHKSSSTSSSIRPPRRIRPSEGSSEKHSGNSQSTRRGNSRTIDKSENVDFLVEGQTIKIPSGSRNSEETHTSRSTKRERERKSSDM